MFSSTILHQEAFHDTSSNFSLLVDGCLCIWCALLLLFCHLIPLQLTQVIAHQNSSLSLPKSISPFLVKCSNKYTNILIKSSCLKIPFIISYTSKTIVLLLCPFLQRRVMYTCCLDFFFYFLLKLFPIPLKLLLSMSPMTSILLIQRSIFNPHFISFISSI
jgi:hypothetical protein